MDIKSLKHDTPRVLKALHVDKKNHLIIAKEEVRIQFPKHYLTGKLGFLDSRYNVAGIITYIVGNSYSVNLTHAIIPFTPDSVNVLKIDSGEYMELVFNKGSIICPNTKLAQKKTLVFEIYDEIIAKGKQPWYVGHTERGMLLDTIQKFAGVDLGAGKALLAIFTSSCMRSPTDRSIPAREFFKTQADYDNPDLIDVIPLRSVAYGADNTTSRILGSYAKVGLASSLVNPSESTADIENILRT